MLCNVEDQMDSLLLRDSAYESKQGHAIVQVAVVEVLHLKGSLRRNVVW